MNLIEYTKLFGFMSSLGGAVGTVASAPKKAWTAMGAGVRSAGLNFKAGMGNRKARMILNNDAFHKKNYMVKNLASTFHIKDKNATRIVNSLDFINKNRKIIKKTAKQIDNATGTNTATNVATVGTSAARAGTASLSSGWRSGGRHIKYNDSKFDKKPPLVPSKKSQELAAKFKQEKIRSKKDGDRIAALKRMDTSKMNPQQLQAHQKRIDQEIKKAHDRHNRMSLSVTKDLPSATPEQRNQMRKDFALLRKKDPQANLSVFKSQWGLKNGVLLNSRSD